MTTISYHSYREFGRKSHADNELEFDDEERMYSLPVYVPYSKVRSHRVSSVVSIIDSVDRVYIRERNRVNLHRVSLKTENEYGEIDSDEGEDDDENKKQDSLGSLDLGLEPLRRIVQDLHRLHSDRPHFSFDQNSAKAAGLPRYCDYLKGNGANEPRQRNTAKFQAIQQKKKVKNLAKK